jgi:hypothetical protein
VNKFFSIVKQVFIWAAFTVGVLMSIGMIYMEFQEKEVAHQAQVVEAPNQVQVHRFAHSSDCPYSVEIESGVWQRSEEIVSAYAAKKSNVYGEYSGTFLQFIATRRTTREDPQATLFDRAECTATDAGSDITVDGLAISLQKATCLIKAEGTHNTPNRVHRLYGTIHGHWVAMGAGIFAINEHAIHQYRPQLIQILKTFKHQCPSEFSPLPRGEAAAHASAAAEQEAAEKATGAAKAAAAK